MFITDIQGGHEVPPSRFRVLVRKKKITKFHNYCVALKWLTDEAEFMRNGRWLYNPNIVSHHMFPRGGVPDVYMVIKNAPGENLDHILGRELLAKLGWRRT